MRSCALANGCQDLRNNATDFAIGAPESEKHESRNSDVPQVSFRRRKDDSEILSSPNLVFVCVKSSRGHCIAPCNRKLLDSRMHSLADAVSSLRKHFGFDDFREGQRDVIGSILEGKDAVVVMPTGSGKSLCYQLPAMMLDGATLVVSPLIALMKDQVDALHARGLPATFINSSISESEQRARIEVAATPRAQTRLRRSRTLSQQPLQLSAAIDSDLTLRSRRSSLHLNLGSRLSS